MYVIFIYFRIFFNDLLLGWWPTEMGLPVIVSVTGELPDKTVQLIAQHAQWKYSRFCSTIADSCFMRFDKLADRHH